MAIGANRRDHKIPLGIVGSGSDWDGRFRQIVGRLKHGRVAVVYSPLPDEAETLGRDTGAVVCHSFRRMMCGRKLRGLLVLESGPLGQWAIAMAVASGLPAFVASPVEQALSSSVDQLTAWEEEGAVLVPGAELRTMPSALRLRELVATKLGAIRQVQIELRESPQIDRDVIRAIDWCRSLLSSTVSSIERKCVGGEDYIQMLCGRSTPLVPPIKTEIRLKKDVQSADVANESTPVRFQAKVDCASGEALLLGERVIHWSTNQERAEEQLDGDRTAEEVLIDLFLRRAVGGVVPVPSWSELREARRLWESLR